MVASKSLAAWITGLAVVLLLSGCGTVKPEANSWSLPKKAGADSGMIIGRLDFPDNNTENPGHIVLYLQTVEFNNTAKAVVFGNNGEEHYIMNNNYFVVPNLKPGHYRFASFRVGELFHSMRAHEEYGDIEIKPGQIKFIGSLDYLQYKQGFLQKLAKEYSYSLRKSQKPTELEMLQWLNRVGKGSGWDGSIKKRIQELGGQS